ncbi:MAG: hypothetical protein QM758_03500 [Armatimonas sp.]
MRTKYFPVLAATGAIVISVGSAQADGYHYYVYINSIATDVTAGITQDGGHVFLNSQWIGDLNYYSGQIINENNEVVGFRVTSPDMLKIRVKK